MKSSIKRKPTGWDGVVAAAILLLAAVSGGGYWARMLSDGGGLTAVVSADGREVDRVVLSGLSAPETRTYTAGGYTLTVEFSPSGVRVAKSDCPNQDCVHTGAVDHPGRSIVCLPARLSVQLTGHGGGSGVDAVVG